MWCKLLSVLGIVGQVATDFKLNQRNNKSLKYNNINQNQSTFNYLTKFGYVNSIMRRGPSNNHRRLSRAIKEFQRFTGLEITGNLDKETEHMMDTPRCGLDDRVANFVARDRKWGKNVLSYRIISYPTNGLRRRLVDLETARAFAMWQEVSNLKFRKRRFGPVDIEISFAKGAHGDQNPFNGRGGVLAHAYFPGNGAISGDAHFDDDEPWSVTPYKGIQLLNTLTHEFGHSLGLEHSRVPGSIMAPYYKGWDTNLRLSDDDIKGIQYLYGKPHNLRNHSPEVTNDDELCSYSIDAIIHIFGGISYVFMGDLYWKLLDTTPYPGYPRTISRDWSGLPGNIDAAVRWSERDVTYFFKGENYWEFTGQTPSEGYPRSISDWYGLPSNLDAALEWDGNLYFFKGSQYWKYDTDLRSMDSSYPRDISDWNGIPTNIDAAFQSKTGVTYFFKGKSYWKLDDQLGPQEYPRSVGQWWFGCNNTGFWHGDTQP